MVAFMIITGCVLDISCLIITHLFRVIHGPQMYVEQQCEFCRCDWLAWLGGPVEKFTKYCVVHSDSIEEEEGCLCVHTVISMPNISTKEFNSVLGLSASISSQSV
jgi:hypothetical protein